MHIKFALVDLKESGCMWENDVTMNSSLEWTQMAQEKLRRAAFGRKKTATAFQFS
jgi:hypothetical protein